jgi:hypothetical protein
MVALFTGSTFNMAEIRLAAAGLKCSGTWNKPPARNNGKISESFQT